MEAKPQEKGATGSRSTARTNGSGSLGVGGARGNFGGIGGGTGESAADGEIEVTCWIMTLVCTMLGGWSSGMFRSGSKSAYCVREWDNRGKWGRCGL